ncbi:MAG: tryptophan 7-halogenase, partial [Acidobacteriota bacterium]|nr:tryptophan 7-halogenase [Acidobacteriota bacterium]
TRSVFFDGALLTIGNRAAFLEPLEATALGFVQAELTAVARWPLGAWRYLPPGEAERARGIASLNRYLRRHVLKMALFVGWHYAHGSAFRTPFWEFARANYERERERFVEPELVAELDRFVARAGQYASLKECLAAGDEQPYARGGRGFAVWPLESFVEMGNGLAGEAQI